MKNILKLKIGTTISGKEINNWIFDQITNDRENRSDATYLLNNFIIKDQYHYSVCKMYRPLQKETVGFMRVY